MENVFYDVVCEENAKTGKRNVTIITRFTNLSKEEADQKAKELLKGVKDNKLPTKNPVEEFFKYVGVYENPFIFDGKTSAVIFMEYKEWSIENNKGYMGNIEFGRIVCNWFGYETKVATIDGKSVRIYKKLN